MPMTSKSASMHNVCASRLFIPKFDPELESRFTEHRRSANVKGVRIAAPLLLSITIALNCVAPWEECSLFYRVGAVASVIAACIGFTLMSVKSVPFWVSDCTIAGAVFMYAAHSFFTFYRLGELLGTECNSDYDDELVGVFSVGGAIHAWSLLLQPSQEAMFFIALICPAIYLLVILVFGTHQASHYIARVYSVFLIVIFCVYQGSRRHEKERRRHFRDITDHQTSWSDLWHAMQHASVPVAVFGATDNVVAGAVALDSAHISIKIWNDAFQMYTEQKVVPGTPFNDVVTIAHESASELKDAVREAIDPALRKTTKKMLTQLVTPNGPAWLQLDIWPVTTASAGFQAMVIGSDVSEFVIAHQSLLQRIPPEQEQSPMAGVMEREQDECLLMSHGPLEGPEPAAAALAPRSASTEASALLHREDCVLSQCTTALSVFFNCPMEGRSLLPHVLGPEQKEIVDAVGRVLEGSGSEQLPVHLFSRPPKDQRLKRHTSRKVFLQFHDTGLGHSTYVRVVIIPECRLRTVSETGDNETTVAGTCGLGAKMVESEPDISPHPETEDRRTQAEVLQSKALQTRKIYVETILFYLTCNLPEAKQSDSVNFLHAALEELQTPQWANRYRRFTGWVCARCMSHNTSDDTECSVCMHERESLPRREDGLVESL